MKLRSITVAFSFWFVSGSPAQDPPQAAPKGIQFAVTNLDLVQSQGMDAKGEIWSCMATGVRPMTRSVPVTLKEVRGGQTVEVTRAVPTQVLGTHIESRSHLLSEIRAFWANGKELTREEKKDHLKRGAMVLYGKGDKLDSKWAPLLAPGAVIVLAPVVEKEIEAPAANVQPRPGVKREPPIIPVPPS